MRQTKGNILPYSIVIFLAAFIMVASFSFVAAELGRVADSSAEWEGGLYREVYYYFPVEVRGAAILNQKDDAGFSFSKVDFQKFLAHSGAYTTDQALYALQVVNSKNFSLSTKDTILLKLRI